MVSQLTPHAQRRAQQRAASLDAINAAIDYGMTYRQFGRTVYFLGRRSVVNATRQGVDLRCFEGLAVVLADDGVVITVIRTSGTRKLRQICFFSSRKFAA